MSDKKGLLPSELQEGEEIRYRLGTIEILFIKEYGSLIATIGPPEYDFNNGAEEKLYHASLLVIDLASPAQYDALYCGLYSPQGRLARGLQTTPGSTNPQ